VTTAAPGPAVGPPVPGPPILFVKFQEEIMALGDMLRDVHDAIHAADNLDRVVDEFDDDLWEEEEIHQVKRAINPVYELLESLSCRMRQEADALGQAEDLIDTLAGLLCRAVRGDRLDHEEVAQVLAGTPHHANVLNERLTISGSDVAGRSGGAGPNTP
jgi:hypothetical protein